MPDEVADRLEVEVGIDKALDCRVAQGVRPRSGNVDTSLEQVLARDRGHRSRPERALGRGDAEEHAAVGRLGAPSPKVVEDRLADDRRERERRGVAGFAFGNRQALAFPVDVVQRERRDLSRPQTVGDEQEQDCVVPPAHLGPALNPGQDPVDVAPGDRPGDAREPVDLGPADRRAQVACEDALAVRVAEKHPQHARSVTDCALGQSRAGTLDDERTEDSRRELLERLDPDPSEVRLEAVEVVVVAEN